MSLHITQLEFISIRDQARCWDLYRLARDNGFSVNKAKGWAMYCMERKQQAGYGTFSTLHPATFRRSKYADHQLFDRLVKINKPRTPKAAIKGLKNYCKILQIDEKKLRAGSRSLNWFRAWSRINKGKMLFIPGWGKFDILEVARELTSQSSNNYSGDKFIPVFSPETILIYGYFDCVDLPGICYIDDFKSHRFQPIVEFIRRRKEDFIHGRNEDATYARHQNQIDELFLIAEDEPRFVNQLRDRLERGDTPTTEEILNEVEDWYNADDQDGLYEDIDFDKPFPITPTSIEPSSTQGVLKTVDTPNELRTISNKMKNCASSYRTQCSKDSPSYVFVALWLNDKPVALGNLNRSGSWEQILGPCNQSLEPEILRAFYQSTSEFYKSFNIKDQEDKDQEVA